MYKIIFLLSLILICFCTPAKPASNDWAEGGPGQKDGATREFYNLAGRLAWVNFMGDWIDDSGQVQGLSPYSYTIIEDTDTVQTVEWDITRLAKGWLEGEYQNQGIFLHALAGTGSVKFRSREFKGKKGHGPQLILELGNKGELAIDAEADTYLEPSTYKSMGHKDELKVGIGQKGGYNCLIRFSLPQVKAPSVKNVRLRMTCFAQYGSKLILIGAFRSHQGGENIPSVLQTGLSEEFYKDNKITEHPSVIFATGFEHEDWKQDWSSVDYNYEVIESDLDHRFEPLSGKALKLWLVKQNHYGSSLTYKLKGKMGKEPEEIFFRYYLRLGNDWNQTVSSGKLPGISGTYGKAGWGARKSNGLNGWSARGVFLQTVQEKTNPLAGKTPIGTYCYHVDQVATYGDIWIWSKGGHGFLIPNTWYCIEQYLRLNSPDARDGILKAWVNGYLVFEKNDIRFRLTDTLKIEQIWLNLFHGGKQVSPYDQHIYLDNLVVARSYIGPMRKNLSVSEREKNDQSPESVELGSIVDWFRQRISKILK